ncbi:VOC family protein [Herbiconiux sp. L3-i23]|uniref:VOC family protein n=1 Tax=Herbiconiux sp. L3-i23 TaxID=2905871 RepID=UPI00206F78D2|nr:VOC family protein [Herbiconiux sp. L3-i23]BDI22856.1 VOC family protein [Herbiconiux sp. L3-i23]
MPTLLNPYFNFRGQAKEAMEFYRSVFGGELIGNTFREFQMPTEPGEEDLIMHSQLTTPGGLTLMGADVPTGMEFHPGHQVSASLSGDDEAELTRFWSGLSEGAEVSQELQKAPWGDSFGMLTDRYGIQWLVNIAGGGQTA